MASLEEIVREVSGNSGAAIVGKDILETIDLSTRYRFYMLSKIIYTSPKTINVAAPNANVRSRSPSPTKTAVCFYGIKCSDMYLEFGIFS